MSLPEKEYTPQETNNEQLPPAPAKKADKTAPLGMGWYKFLIYFSLFCSAFLNAINGLGFLTGLTYFVQTNGEINAALVYAYYGSILKAVDVVYGFGLIGIAVLCIVLRQKLAHFKSDAIKFMVFLYTGIFVLSLFYIISVSVITGESFTGNDIRPLCSNLIFLLINVRYFKRRAHLFVSNQAAANSVITESAHPLYCKNCGTPLLSGAAFCHQCGTKI